MGDSDGTAAAPRPRILLVEDDPGVRRSLQLLFQGRGLDVRAYAAGEKLLGDPLADGAACLVADYRMSGLDGLVLLARLRGRGWAGRAVLITAHPSGELEHRARQHGYDAVIEKPFLRSALADAVAGLATLPGTA